jgi:hypothetical protein
MQKIIRNKWNREAGEPYSRAKILSNETHPEGLDVERIRFIEGGRIIPKSEAGHIISFIRGSGLLRLADDNSKQFNLEGGVHLYLPPGIGSVIDVDPGSEIIKVSSISATQARGKQMLLRDETFVSACAYGTQALRWILTPQYLSRRIFLHHDPVLLSKNGNPVSWFRTTMFDVAGLPLNQDGEPVFKMSYNSRTEFNVCYDVEGTARVRMAKHPYDQANQLWGPWLQLDNDSTYHLNESAGSVEEECILDNETRTPRYLRNKHEVYIINGHVTLFCMFDPAPTGVENHKPGEYSDYEPLAQVLGTEAYENHKRVIAKYDEMVDQLSLAKAMGSLSTLHGTSIWELYQQGRAAQAATESNLAKTLTAEGRGREKVLARWMQT